MSKKIYAVMGATGHIGQGVVEKLLEKGHAVKALGRNDQKLAALKAKGAETLKTAFNDAAALTGAFKGADGVFIMTPPSYEDESLSAAQDAAGEAIVRALTDSGVKYAVNLSSVGAEQPSGTGPITGLYRQEQRLAKLTGLNLVNLRPTSFMENSFFGIPVIKAYGINGGAFPGDYPMPTVATKDIAQKIAEFLDSLSFQGHQVFDFTGPKEYSMVEVTKALGTAIGKPDLKYVQTPLEDIKKGMLQSGMKPGTADLMIEMYAGGMAGKIHPTQEFTAEKRGKTTIDEFAKTFAAVFAQG
jgi:uncharacterized protein YbjT (DUF2867 family)